MPRRAAATRIAICLALSVISLNLLAQTDTASGELRGTVRDPSGAVVPAARITMKSIETGLVRQTTSGDAGEYGFLVVPPGEYDVQIDKDQFQPELLHGVRITVGQVATLDVPLKLGAVKDTLVLNGD